MLVKFLLPTYFFYCYFLPSMDKNGSANLTFNQIGAIFVSLKVSEYLTNYVFTMAPLRCVTILLGLVLYIEAQANNTDLNRPVNSNNTVNTERPAPHYVLRPLRRAVLILQTNNDKVLRSSDYNSLKYIEYDDVNGTMLNEVFMYNLKDVANFFEVYLDTKICYNTCNS
ncbi:uncharacterized protein LOC134678940 [Cydia fagiglandana]|uniref:uncharacterized protein LOC134678940 n=1 Tax=Cydia fagiglandana TaxID=1458189 RepID=UPI002FEE4D74